MSTLAEFLLARIAEDETAADVLLGGEWSVGTTSEHAKDGVVFRDDGYVYDIATPVRRDIAEHIARHDPVRILAECEAKRRIIELHESWPVLVSKPPKLEENASAGTDRMVVQLTQQLQWHTQQEYRAKFGDEPPTAPILLALAQPYASHPDFHEEWRA